MEYNPIHLGMVWVLFATVLVFLMQAVVRSLLALVRIEIVSNPHLIFMQCICTKACRAYMLGLSISTLVDM
jgi:hypothetical protein